MAGRSVRREGKGKLSSMGMSVSLSSPAHTHHSERENHAMPLGNVCARQAEKNEVSRSVTVCSSSVYITYREEREGGGGREGNRVEESMWSQEKWRGNTGMQALSFCKSQPATGMPCLEKDRQKKMLLQWQVGQENTSKGRTSHPVPQEPAQVPKMLKAVRLSGTW